jgi:hypothetical protein
VIVTGTANLFSFLNARYSIFSNAHFMHLCRLTPQDPGWTINLDNPKRNDKCPPRFETEAAGDESMVSNLIGTTCPERPARTSAGKQADARAIWCARRRLVFEPLARSRIGRGGPSGPSCPEQERHIPNPHLRNMRKDRLCVKKSQERLKSRPRRSPGDAT